MYSQRYLESCNVILRLFKCLIVLSCTCFYLSVADELPCSYRFPPCTNAMLYNLFIMRDLHYNEELKTHRILSSEGLRSICRAHLPYITAWSNSSIETFFERHHDHNM